MKITDVKHCSGCRQHKMRTEFNKNWTTVDGLQPWCRVCTKRKSAERRAAFRTSVQVPA